MEVALEVFADGGWRQVGSAVEFMPPGSISSEEPDGRQVFIFGWVDGAGPGVWRSVAGADVENSAVREIFAAALEQLSDLIEPLELEWWRQGQAMRVRFRRRSS